MTVNDLRSISVNVGFTTSTEQSLETAANRLAGMHLVRRIGNTTAQETLSYYFPYTPQEIQYSNFSPELSEINRPGRQPIIALNRFRARQVSFRFLIARPLDGLVLPVDDSVEFVHRMALAARPVFFTNLDRQITNPLSSGDSETLFWSITDLTFSSVRRNSDNKITAAEANLSLVENTNPTIKIADLPRITYTTQTPAANRPASSADRSADFNSYTSGMQRGNG
jgi:hypothetical protein